MKLLFDENLSPRLVQALSTDYPESAHIRDLDLESGTDRQVWKRAQSDGYVLVSKDSDFRQMSFLFGPPPKVVWVRMGNSTTDEVLTLLRERTDDLRSFYADPEAAFLVLG